MLKDILELKKYIKEEGVYNIYYGTFFTNGIAEFGVYTLDDIIKHKDQSKEALEYIETVFKTAICTYEEEERSKLMVECNFGFFIPETDIELYSADSDFIEEIDPNARPFPSMMLLSVYEQCVVPDGSKKFYTINYDNFLKEAAENGYSFDKPIDSKETILKNLINEEDLSYAISVEPIKDKQYTK